MSLSDEERRAIVLYRVEKARKAIEDIHKVFPLEVWGIIANRMYYALYYAATALLVQDEHKVGTHKGVISLFNLYYIKTGMLTREDGTLLGTYLRLEKATITMTLLMPQKMRLIITFLGSKLLLRR